MKKVAVYSFFESENLGDILIANSIKKIFNEHKCEFFSIIDGKPAKECGVINDTNMYDNRRKIKSRIHKILVLGDFARLLSSLKSKNYISIVNSCRHCDTVVFAGGNIMMELSIFPTAIFQLYRAVKKQKIVGKKVYFLFAGVGPFKCKTSFSIAKKIILMADFISVRDEYSKMLVNKAVPQKPIEIWYDPVLLEEKICKWKKNNNAIGINVYFGNSNNEDQIRNAFVKFINSILMNFKGYQIVLFSSVLTDYKNIDEVKAYFGTCSLVTIEHIGSTEQLYRLYKKIDFVLALRMHTLITATISGIPAVSVSWQPKVASLMDLLGNSHYNFNLNDFINHNDAVVEMMRYISNNTEEIVNSNLRSIIELRKKSAGRIDKFLSDLEG